MLGDWFVDTVDRQSGGTCLICVHGKQGANKGPTCTDRGPKCASTVPPPQDFHFNHCVWLTRVVDCLQMTLKVNADSG